MTRKIRQSRKSNRKKYMAALFLLFGNIMFFLTIWLLQKYNKICIDQFLFSMKSTSEGVHHALAGSAVLGVGGYSVIATCLELGLYKVMSGTYKERLGKYKKYLSYCSTKLCRFFKRRFMSLSVTAFGLGCTVFVTQLDVFSYLGTIMEKSDFIEIHYADPEQVNLRFPEKKRNIVYIFLESMENTFGDTQAGGIITADYIPELTKLAKEHVNFSHTQELGGAYAYAGTTWTASAMAAQTSGIPVKMDITQDAYGAEDAFLPGVTALGDILEQEEYHQVLLLGSDAQFHGREAYFKQHGNYEIIDIQSLKEEGRLKEDYLEWWGFEDEKLFAFAREELSRLAEEGKPFNFTMLTADTHFPDGYACRLCRKEHAEQYANVLSCSSRQVAQFVEWIMEQPFYENTTIVISGDHLTMDGEFLEELDEEYIRTVYNCIIHAPVEPLQEKKREFGTFDMLPTTLAAMGVEIEGNRLGLGTNLFSGEETLTEKYGFEALEKELQKTSEFYNKKFLCETDKFS